MIAHDREYHAAAAGMMEIYGHRSGGDRGGVDRGEEHPAEFHDDTVPGREAAEATTPERSRAGMD